MEQGKAHTFTEVLNSVFDKYKSEGYIHAEKLPDIDLYVDQVTTLLTQHLEKTMRFDDDKIMTKTMINNYAKNHLLPPPVKKKYSRDHILLLVFIYYFKNFLPISDIQTILKPLTEQYFQSEDALNLETIYTTLFSKETTLVDAVYDTILQEYEMSGHMFEGAPEENQAYLRQFSMICVLSLDVYLKKQLIEQCIDQMLSPTQK